MNLASALAAGRRAEVEFSGSVTTVPRFFYGARTHCEHEAFMLRTSSGPVEVVDNVAIAPRIPVAPGDTVDVRGELVRDQGRPPVVHWTHHDPSGVHADGFIRLRGRVYA